MFATGLAMLIIGYGFVYIGVSHFTGSVVKFWDAWGIGGTSTSGSGSAASTATPATNAAAGSTGGAVGALGASPSTPGTLNPGAGGSTLSPG